VALNSLSSETRRLILNAVLVALALYITLAFARIPGRTSAIWLPTGVEIGLLLRLPRRQWRASLVVYFLLTLVGVTWSGAQRWTLGVGWPVVNTAGAWLTAHLLARDPDWVQGRTERMSAWIRFTWIGGLLVPALWGLAGAALLATAPSFPGTPAAFGTAALGRFVNNALSIFVLVPMFLRFEQLRALREPARLRAALGWLGLFCVLVAGVFTQRSVLSLFVLPLGVVFLLFKLEFVGTIACMVILLVGAFAGTLAHTGPFIALTGGDWPQALLMAQGYLMTIFATIVLMTGLLAERQAMAQRTIELATESARMKSEFLAKMSHEIRTPLNAILGFADLLRQDAQLSGENLQSVRIINQSGKHLLTLINEVLDMAKIDAGHAELAPTDIELAGFIDSLAAMMALRAERKGLAFVVDAEPGLPAFVRVDALKLRQVLLNLVGNAIKFTERGQVLLTLRHVQAVPGAREGWLQVVVGDTGPGIAPEDRARLFGAFQQGHAGRHSQGGTGLGLAISQHFVALMGGTIELDSEPGQGSRFAFSVKVAQAERGEVEPVSRDAVGRVAGTRQPLVLVADDTEANRSLMARLMHKFDIATACVPDGLAALDAFATQRPDLIWMDLVMPHLRGDEAMRRIRAMPGGAAVKIVCVTADAFGWRQAEAGDALNSGSQFKGFDAVVFKPVHEARLVEVLHDLLGLEFIYGQADAAAERRTHASQDAEWLAQAPGPWRQQFQQAVLTGDMRRLQQQIDALPPGHAPLRGRLQALLDGIDLPALAALSSLEVPAPAAPPADPETQHEH
jgi:signal transduction histidine kinase/CheY-like chemotaxis protein